MSPVFITRASGCGDLMFSFLAFLLFFGFVLYCTKLRRCHFSLFLRLFSIGLFIERCGRLSYLLAALCFLPIDVYDLFPRSVRVSYCAAGGEDRARMYFSTADRVNFDARLNGAISAHLSILVAVSDAMANHRIIAVVEYRWQGACLQTPKTAGTGLFASCTVTFNYLNDILPVPFYTYWKVVSSAVPNLVIDAAQ